MSRRRNVTRDDARTAHVCGLCPREAPERMHLCGHCADILLDDLIQLHDWLLAELETAITGERAVSYSGSGGSSGDGHDVRINWRAAQAHAEVKRVLIALLRGTVIGWPDKVADLVSLADWLSQCINVITAHPLSPGIASALRDAVRGAMRVIDLPPERMLVGRCPSCEVGRVYADPISDFGKCDTCRDRHEAAPLWDTTMGGLEDQLVTAAEAARLAIVMGLAEDREKVRGRIRTWANRGHLEAHESATGETVYRFGDVWSRLAQV